MGIHLRTKGNGESQTPLKTEPAAHIEILAHFAPLEKGVGGRMKRYLLLTRPPLSAITF